MVSGLADKLNIPQRSPHDREAVPGQPSPFPIVQHWVPSRYNVRATAEDGRLVLWNSMSEAITVFDPQDRERVLGLLQKKGFRAPRKKVVAYLAERGHIVPRGTDEYHKFQHLFGEQHYRSDNLELIVMSTEDCNFRCKYCYEDFARGTMQPEVREGIKNLVRKRIRKLNHLQISWFGGEPLYGWEAVEDLAPFFVEIAEEHGVPYHSTMTTNGYLLTPKVADKLFSWRVRTFQITLDGLPVHHDRSRVTRDGGATFATIFENLKALRRREDDFRVQLRVNFDHNNAGGLCRFIDLLTRELRNDARYHIDLHPIGKWGGPHDAQLDVCGGGDAERIEREILDKARKQGVHFKTLKDTARLGGQVCYAARPFSFLISASGKVMKCTVLLDKDESNVVGRITPQGGLDLDIARLARWTGPAFEQDGQCRKCVVLPTCQGISCPLVRIESQRRPCISTRRNPKGELLSVLDAPGTRERQGSMAV